VVADAPFNYIQDLIAELRGYGNQDALAFESIRVNSSKFELSRKVTVAAMGGCEIWIFNQNRGRHATYFRKSGLNLRPNFKRTSVQLKQIQFVTSLSAL
jgi:hypothetical protein